MGIERSVKRPEEIESFSPGDNFKIEAIGAVNLHIPLLVNHLDFFPAAFRFKCGEKLLYIDPVKVDKYEKADYILITHKHQDHFLIEDIEKLLKSQTVIICPQKVFVKLTKKIKGAELKQIKPGEKLNYDEIVIETVAAYNDKKGLIIPHPKSHDNVGYIIGFDGFRIYHAGDTDYVEEIKTLKDITAAFVPIDGDGLTMSTEKAAELVNNMKPEFAIPMHYSLGTPEVKKFRKLVDESVNVIIMDGQQ